MKCIQSVAFYASHRNNFGRGLALELGMKIFHPKHSGRSSVQVSIGSSTLSPRPNASRAVMLPKWGTAARAINSALDPLALLGFHP